MRVSLFKGWNQRTKETPVHRNAKLTVEGRKLLVDRILKGGWPPATAAEAQGCSSATAYKWLGRFESEGLAGLEDRSSRPHTSPRRLSAEREQQIIDRRNSELEGPHPIGWALGIAPSTVHKVLRRNNVARLCDIDRATRTVVRYQRERPGELIHIDIKKQARIPDGGGWKTHGNEIGRRNNAGYRLRSNGKRRRTLGYDYIHAAVDDCSRVAYAEVHGDERKETATEFTKRAIAHFMALGITVERVMTDGGSCYRSKQFRELLSDNGIKHKRTRPYRPQTNGKVERFNLTLKLGWAYAREYSSNQARLDDLPVWLHHYNHHRPHMAHKGKAPMACINNLCGNHT
jgi:transposase InsO family protein/transposase